MKKQPISVFVVTVMSLCVAACNRQASAIPDAVQHSPEDPHPVDHVSMSPVPTPDTTASDHERESPEQTSPNWVRNAEAELLPEQGPAVALRFEEGSSDRVQIPENQSVSLRVKLPALAAGEPVAVVSPMGGSLSRKGGELAFIADGESAELDLVLAPTSGKGAYLIEVRHRGERLKIPLWFGPLPPPGAPGPAMTFAEPTPAGEWP